MSAARVPRLILAHEPALAGNVGGEAAPNTLDGHSKAFDVDSRIPS